MDEKVPDWRERVSAHILQVDHLELCILGQLFDSYYAGVRALGIFVGWEYGFDMVVSEIDSDGSYRGIRYGELDREWKAVLAA